MHIDANAASGDDDISRDVNSNASSSSTYSRAALVLASLVAGDAESSLPPDYAARIDACAFVAQCAASLLLDQATTLTALVLCQRFFARRRQTSFSAFDARIVAGACVLISTKSCEVPRTLRSVVNVVHAATSNSDVPLGTGSRYSELKMALINAEQTVLRVLGFDIDVPMPLNFLLSYAQQRRFSAATAQCAVKLATDAHFDLAALDLPAFVVGAASLRIASLVQEEDRASSDDKWWYLYDTSDEDIATVAKILLRLYRWSDKQRDSSSSSAEAAAPPTPSARIER